MTITALPLAPSTTDPSTFDAKADALLAALPTFITETNATAVAMNLNSTTDTSASSVLLGTGAKTFTVTAGKSFQPGMYLVCADAAAPSTNSMYCQITSYSGTTLIVNVLSVAGSGTKTAWVISQSAGGASGFADIVGSSSQAFSVGAATNASHAVRNDQIATSFQDFRLTLASGSPVFDVTGATTIYMTPFRGNKISLYTGGVWRVYASNEISGALGTLTAALPYDVFAYDNAGTVTLAFVAWTNNTTRTTALVYQDGVLCKSGATAYRYLGTFYTTSTTTTEDSVLKRNLWNYYNRVARMMVRQDVTGSWTYTTAAWRQANNTAANQLEAVQGVAEDVVVINVYTPVQNTNAGVVVASGIGFDSTSVNSALGGGVAPAAAAAVGISLASYEAVPSAGWHKYCWLEYSAATGTTTWLSASATVLFAAMKGRVIT